MSRPEPGSSCRACRGIPASCSNWTARYAMIGVGSAGLANTALPAARAALTCPVKMARGKFHGLMQAKTPRPCSVTWLCSPVGPGMSRGLSNSSRACSA